MKLPSAYKKDLDNLSVLRRRMVAKLMDGGFDDSATIPQLLNANMNVFKMLALEIDLRKEIEEPNVDVGSAVRKYETYFSAKNAGGGRTTYSRARTAPADDSPDSGFDTDGAA